MDKNQLVFVYMDSSKQDGGWMDGLVNNLTIQIYYLSCPLFEDEYHLQYPGWLFQSFYFAAAAVFWPNCGCTAEINTLLYL